MSGDAAAPDLTKGFWDNIYKLKVHLTSLNCTNTKQNKVTVREEVCAPDLSLCTIYHSNFLSRHIKGPSSQLYASCAIIQKIQKIFERCIESISHFESPSITVPNRKKWENMSFSPQSGLQMTADHSFTTIKFSNRSSLRKFSLFLHILSKIHYLLQKNVYCTKRELYYQDVNLFGSQSMVDSILDDIACLFGVQKIDLHVGLRLDGCRPHELRKIQCRLDVFNQADGSAYIEQGNTKVLSMVYGPHELTTSKGCIVGDLQFKDSDGNCFDCHYPSKGVILPNDVSGITSICSSARFILVVEKDAVFQNLLDGNIMSSLFPLIMITGKGFPDVNTRQIVRILWDALQIPILCLVDADPYGIEILCVYRFGSMTLSFDAKNLAVPEIRWLGVHPTDIRRLHIPESALLELTENDVIKAKNLLSRPYFQCNQDWSLQIHTLLLLQKKVEIEGLDKISNHFLCNIYLPSKIKLGGWI